MRARSLFAFSGAAALAAVVLPSWLLFLLTIALAKSLVALGLVILFRCGLVSFGHGLYYCIGAYAPGVLGQALGVTDALAAIAGGFIAASLAGAIFGSFLSRYRGVYFAMFNLALSMMLYGALLKARTLGGSDGLSIPPPTLFGFATRSGNATIAIYLLAAAFALAGYAFAQRFFRSTIGLRSLGVRENEIRIDYLGASSGEVVFINYVISAGLAGIGGALSALATGHVTPELSYWTVSGEFVFISVLSGYTSVLAVPAASLLFETVRLVAGQFLPHSWQLILGAFLLLTIFFAPDGLGAIWPLRRRGRVRGTPAPAARPQ